MNFQETLPYHFSQFSTFFKVEIEKELTEHELHSGQVFILFTLWESDGLSQIELASKLRLSAPTINRMVKSLQKNGFVISSASQTDGRVVNVFLTPKGVAVRPQIEEKWIKIEEKILANLTPTEQLVLTQLFSKIVENLTQRE